MTKPLPVVGAERDTWGEKLNDYLAELSAISATKAHVGLGSADNTSDADKPVSTLTAAALAEKLAGISANKFGADPGAAWTVNRDAFQAANDAAHAAGGGRVFATPGTYLLKGLWQDSHVEFYGPGVTLKHPDGNDTDMVSARRFTTTGSIAAGAFTLTVDDATNIEVGCVLAIRGGGGASSRQSSALTANASASVGAMTLTSATGWADAECGMIGTELVTWATRVGAQIQSLVRGAYGTTAATHSTGEVFYQAQILYTEVTAVVGNVVTVSVAPTVGVVGAPVTIGSVGLALTDISFDGSRIMPGGGTDITLCVAWAGVRWSTISGGTYTNGHLGAIQLGVGAADNTLKSFVARDCGIPANSLGAVVWLFRACRRNRIISPMISGDCYNGIYIDDRTVTSTEWDAPCDGNTVTAPNIALVRAGSNAALLIVGSNYNQVLGGSTANSRTGVVIDANQHNTFDGSRATARGNLVSGVAMDDHYNPISLSAPGNRVVGNPWHNCTAPADTGGNVTEDNGLDTGSGNGFAAAGLPIGYHWTSTPTSATAAVVGNNELMLSGFDVPRTCHIIEIGMEIVTAASSGRFRLGYYYDDGTGRPGQLAWDAGAAYVDATATGVQWITVSRGLRAGRFWIGAALNSALGTMPVIRVAAGDSSVAMPARPGAGDVVAGYRRSGVPSSLPTPFVATGAALVVPLMFVNVDA